MSELVTFPVGDITVVLNVGEEAKREMCLWMDDDITGTAFPVLNSISWNENREDGKWRCEELIYQILKIFSHDMIFEKDKWYHCSMYEHIIYEDISPMLTIINYIALQMRFDKDIKI